MTKLLCTVCKSEMSFNGNASETCVGYFSPPGHNHNDNCLRREYECPCGEKVNVSKRRACSHPECDWKGKEKCFCHDMEKVEEWPEDSNKDA